MNLLFVCTGNTCRSPMAAEITKKLIRQNPGGYADFYVASAGIYAEDGEPASEGAIAVIKEMGGDLQQFQAQSISAELLETADVVLTMTQAHKRILTMLGDTWKDKIFTLGEFAGVSADIADPFGGSMDEYRKCARQMEILIESGLKRLEDKKGKA